MKILKSLLQISLISFVGILISCENNSDSYEIIEPAIQEPIDLSKDSLYISKNNPSTFELVDFKVTVNTNGKETRKQKILTEELNPNLVGSNIECN